MNLMLPRLDLCDRKDRSHPVLFFCLFKTAAAARLPHKIRPLPRFPALPAILARRRTSSPTRQHARLF